MRHAWREREYARLHADIVEARITARARETERAAERAARARRWLLGGVPDRIGVRRSAPVRSPRRTVRAPPPTRPTPSGRRGAR